MLKHPFLKTYVWGFQEDQDSTLAGRLAQLAIESSCRERRKRLSVYRHSFHMVSKQMKMMPNMLLLYKARCESCG